MISSHVSVSISHIFHRQLYHEACSNNGGIIPSRSDNLLEEDEGSDDGTYEDEYSFLDQHNSSLEAIDSQVPEVVSSFATSASQAKSRTRKTRRVEPATALSSTPHYPPTPLKREATTYSLKYMADPPSETQRRPGTLWLCMMFLIIAYQQPLPKLAVVVHVDSNEVNDNVLLPNLLVFRITDYKDEGGRLHHGYQIVYIGDYMNASKGLLEAKLISPTKVLVTLPACPHSFTDRQNAVQTQMKAEYAFLPQVKNSYTSAASKLRSETAGWKTFQVIVDFTDTGEDLTDNVFPEEDFLLVSRVSLSNADLIHAGETVSTTELYAGFNFARVETEVRMGKIEDDEKLNMVAKAFKRSVRVSRPIDDEDMGM